MAKTRKAPVATAADPFFDAEGHALTVNDIVLVSQEGASIYNGHSGTIKGLHREGANAVATVAFSGDSTVAAGSQAFFLKWLTYVASHPAIQEEPDLPWLDCDGNVLLEGDKAHVLPDVSTRLSGKLVKVLGDYDPQKKSVQVEPVGWEGADFGILLCFLKRLPVLGESVVAPTPAERMTQVAVLGSPSPELVAKVKKAVGRKQEPVAPFVNTGQAQFEEGKQTGLASTGFAPTVTGAMVYTPTKMKLVLLADILVTSNTRKVFDEASLAELAESIKSSGVISPITVRPHATEAGKFELVAGERRYRASKLAEQVTIPAVIRTLTDREFLEVQLLENLQRVDVRPADEAHAFNQLLKSNFSAEEIAQRVGKPVKFVLQRAKLTNLVPFWMDLLEQDKLLLVAAHLIARLPAHSQVVVRKAAEKGYSWALKSGGLSLEQVKSIISQEVQRDLAQACFPKEDASLYPQAGACLTCPKRSGANASLFDDVASGKDNCLDAGCFAEKKRLYVLRRLAELTVGKEKPLLISTQTWDTKTRPGLGMVYGSGKWNTSKEGEANAILALVVEGVEAGAQRWVKFSGIKTAAEEKKEQEQKARQLRAEREAQHHRELIADKLCADMERDLYSEGPIAHKVLERFLVEKLSYSHSVVPKDMLDYLATNYGWERPTAAQLKNGYADRVEQTQRTPHYQFLYDQLERMTVRNKLHLWFALHFRSNLAGGYSSTQTGLAKHIGTGYGYDTLEEDAKKVVEERYYSKGKKQEATA